MPIFIKDTDSEDSKVVLRYRPRPRGNEILSRARESSAAHGLEFAGNVTPEEAWALFSAGVAKLVDVRTEKELDCVGYVRNTQRVEWFKGSAKTHDRSFLSELAAVVNKEDVVLFLCRSGKRSVLAAESATKAGYRNAFNVLEGFEGDGCPRQGWLNRGLPSARD